MDRFEHKAKGFALGCAIGFAFWMVSNVFGGEQQLLEDAEVAVTCLNGDRQAIAKFDGNNTVIVFTEAAAVVAQSQVNGKVDGQEMTKEVTAHCFDRKPKPTVEMGP